LDVNNGTDGKSGDANNVIPQNGLRIENERPINTIKY
jgi:hypothetical protein